MSFNPAAGLLGKLKKLWNDTKNDYLEWERSQQGQISESVVKNHSPSKRKRRPSKEPSLSPKRRKNILKDQKKDEESIPNAGTQSQNFTHLSASKIRISDEDRIKPLVDLNQDHSFDMAYLTPASAPPPRFRFVPPKSDAKSPSAPRSLEGVTSLSDSHFNSLEANLKAISKDSNNKAHNNRYDESSLTNPEFSILVERLKSIEENLQSLQERISHCERSVSLSPSFAPPSNVKSPVQQHRSFVSSSARAKKNWGRQSNSPNSNKKTDHAYPGASMNTERGLIQNLEDSDDIHEESSDTLEEPLLINELNRTSFLNSNNNLKLNEAEENQNLLNLRSPKSSGKADNLTIKSSSNIDKVTSNDLYLDNKLQSHFKVTESQPTNLGRKEYSNSPFSIRARKDAATTSPSFESYHNTQTIQSPMKFTKATPLKDNESASVDESKVNVLSENQSLQADTATLEQLTPIPKARWNQLANKHPSLSNSAASPPVSSPGLRRSHIPVHEGLKHARDGVAETKDALAKLREKMQERLKNHTS
ncbi:hypothetical protein POMI540_3068 [Schizosaccharomyces pombe]